ncbi:MAG: hypothetical protein SFV51_24650 [Bryobacteraceae bacterium]|nr:hypothetical protein [Bryobacteraceae bacterium]
MLLSEVFLGLGEDNFTGLLRSVSIGKLRTFRLYDRVKARAHLTKLNSETLRKAAPRLWERMAEKDDEFATDISQAVLVSHMDMIQAVLDFLGVPHEDGFFAKDADVSSYLTEGWRERAYNQFQEKYPKEPLLFYVNHLAWEIQKPGVLFQPSR